MMKMILSYLCVALVVCRTATATAMFSEEATSSDLEHLTGSNRAAHHPREKTETDHKMHVVRTRAPSDDERQSDELQEIQETLGIMRREMSQKQTCGETGLGAVVAQQLVELSSVKSDLLTRLHATETRLQATETRLQATEADLQTTKTKLQATEAQLQKTETSSQATETRLQATETSLKTTFTRLQATETLLHTTERRLNTTELDLATTLERSDADDDLGSTYIRWGRKSCPGNSTLVYVGVAGGKQYTQKGSGTNRLCLTREPEFDDLPKPPHFGHIYGGEYQDIIGHLQHDVPCSVCWAPQSTTIMVPATLTCPSGWAPQYTGHLISAHKDHFATEYVCLDGNPEDDADGESNDNGLLFYYVITQCGSLPCPPFVNNKVVTCVVCSK